MFSVLQLLYNKPNLQRCNNHTEDHVYSFFNAIVKTGQGESSNRRYDFLKEPNITAILSSSAIKLLLNRHTKT